MIFAVSANYREKTKESETIYKFLDLAWEPKKLSSMRVIVILIVFGALGTVCKGFDKSLEELEIGKKMETHQITALLRLTRILKKSSEDLRRFATQIQ